MAQNSGGGKYRRVQLDFSEEAFAELEEMQKQVHAASRAEVLRLGLGLLRWLQGHIDEGHKIKVEKEDGELTEVEFAFLTPSKGKVKSISV